MSYEGGDSYIHTLIKKLQVHKGPKSSYNFNKYVFSYIIVDRIIRVNQCLEYPI